MCMCDYCEGRGDDDEEEVIEPDYEPEEENEV